MDKEFLRQIDKVDELLGDHSTLKFDNDVLICECFCVSAGDIRQFYGNSKEVDLKTLEMNFGFGQGCKSCLKTSNEWIEKIF